MKSERARLVLAMLARHCVPLVPVGVALSLADVSLPPEKLCFAVVPIAALAGARGYAYGLVGVGETTL